MSGSSGRGSADPVRATSANTPSLTAWCLSRWLRMARSRYTLGDLVDTRPTAPKPMKMAVRISRRTMTTPS